MKRQLQSFAIEWLCACHVAINFNRDLDGRVLMAQLRRSILIVKIKK